MRGLSSCVIGAESNDFEGLASRVVWIELNIKTISGGLSGLPLGAESNDFLEDLRVALIGLDWKLRNFGVSVYQISVSRVETVLWISYCSRVVVFDLPVCVLYFLLVLGLRLIFCSGGHTWGELRKCHGDNSRRRNQMERKAAG